MFKIGTYNTVKILIVFLLKSFFLGLPSIASVFSFEFLFNRDFLLFMIWISLDFLGFLLFYLLLLWKNFLVNQASELILYDYQKQLIKNLSHSPMTKIKQKSSGYYLSIFHNDLQDIKNNVFKNYLNMIDYLFSFIVLIAVLSYFSYVLLIVVCVNIVVLKFLTLFLEKWNTKIIDAYNKQKNTFLDKMLNIIYGFSKFVFQNKVGLFVKQILIKSKILSREKIKHDLKNNGINVVIDSFIAISQFLILVIVGLLFYNDFLQIGVFLVIVGISTEFINLSNDFNSSILEIRSTKNIKAKVKNIFIDDENKNLTIINKVETIKIENANFSYQDKKIFENLNVSFQKNKKYLIVAPNGRGKSTLIKLILGLLKLEKGQILIDDININNINLKSFHHNIIFLDNNPYVFNTNLENNITIYDTEVKQNEYQKAINEALVDFDLKNNLSSGQKQRINISRLFYNPKKIIILDEALANIDKNRRNIIENNLLNLDATIINITHHYDLETKNKYDFVIEL